MITVISRDDRRVSHVVTPTIFPDGTSQVWKLPQEIIDCAEVEVVWNFENEAELISVCSLSKLLTAENVGCCLTIPYLPYARQDKQVSNNTTFNLEVLGNILATTDYKSLLIVDPHSYENANRVLAVFNGSRDCLVLTKPFKFHRDVCDKVQPDCIVYPDAGAANRYEIEGYNRIIFYKERNQLTGEVSHSTISYRSLNCGYTIQNADIKDVVSENKSYLIIDDICDGGATFTSIARKIKEFDPNADITLAVTHGIFSKGKQVLKDAGINRIFTTNTLKKNEGTEECITCY